MAARRADGVDFELGEIVGAGHRVIHETAGQQLAGFAVIHAVFQQRLANALDDAAMHLAFDNHRVDDGAKVVHGGEAVNPRLAGGRVHFYFADVGASREGEVGRVVKGGFVQARLQLVQRVVVRHIGRQRHLAESDFLVGALDGELAIGKFDVGVTGLHQMRGNFLGLGFDFVQRLHDGRTADRDGARAVGAHTERHAASIAMHHVNVLDGDAQARRHDLGKRRLMALAMAV